MASAAPEPATLRLVAPGEAPLAWAEAGPLLAGAIARGDGNYTPYDVYLALVDGRMQLWIAELGGRAQAAMVTRIVDYPQKRVCAVAWLGGRRRESWWPLMPQLELWARAMGCVAVEAWVGRRGWRRLLPDWRPVYRVLRKEID